MDRRVSVMEEKSRAEKMKLATEEEKAEKTERESNKIWLSPLKVATVLQPSTSSNNFIFIAQQPSMKIAGAFHSFDSLTLPWAA